MKAKKNTVRVLFIGNSHTYYNDMPQFVKMMAEEDGYDCTVTMLAHAGWYLSEHAEEPEVRFNILYGKYDYVVLQEHAHPFGPEEKFHEAAAALNDMIRHAGSIPVIFECWARKAEPEIQNHMNEVHKQVAAEIDALLAYVKANPSRLRAIKIKADNESQLDYPIVYRQINPFTGYIDQKRIPAQYQRSGDNNTKVIELTDINWILGADNLLLTTIGAGRTVVISLVFGASLDTEKGLQKKADEAMANAAALGFNVD